ncbi:hypothetical protein [Niabella aquatica]
MQNNIESLTNIALADNKLYVDPFQDSFLLFENSLDSGYIIREIWGIFPSASLKVTCKGRTQTTAFMYGASRHHYESATLYLTDHDRPLSLTGDTYIEGNVFLPKSGVRSGFFDQKGFSGKKLIEGNTDTSQKKLPVLAAALTNQLRRLAQFITETEKGVSLSQDITQSFFSDAQYIRANKWGKLSNKSLAGRIIVISDSIIEVDESSRLKDVLLIAPFIHFKEGFTGSVQAFALDSITIETGCHLTYPSAIVGIGRQDVLGNTGATVTMHSGCLVEGIIMSLIGEATSNIRPVIKINKMANINGLVYNEGYTYLNGKIAGAIFSDFFFEQRGPISMENILIDATIVKSKWLANANYFSVFDNASVQRIIKWLY